MQPGASPAPLESSATTAHGTENDVTPVPTLAGSADDKRSWRIVFAPSPEPAGFPTGAFRAATRMCLEETQASADGSLELKLSISGGHVKAVTSDKAATSGNAPPALVPCLQRLYAKVNLGKTAPSGLSAQVSFTVAGAD